MRRRDFITLVGGAGYRVAARRPRAASDQLSDAPPSTEMNCRRPMLKAICFVPAGIMPAVIWGRISRTNRQVCDRLHPGPTAKWLAVFAAPACRRNRPVTVAQPDGIRVRYRVNTGRAHSWLARPSLTHSVILPPQYTALRKSHSITWSARADSVGEISSPSDFAVFKLMTNWYLVGCTTGRSLGFSPLRMRPA